MKVIFFGSSSFSIPFLYSIHNSDNEVALLVTGSEKSRGRGREKSANPVKKTAEESGIDTLEIDDFDRSAIDRIVKTGHDCLVLVSFGKILPAGLIERIEDKAINMHPSLLPRYRGPSPIITALLNGDKKTGVSLIKISRKVDEGDIFMQKEIKIDENDNKDILEQKVVDNGTSMLLELLDILKKGNVASFPQHSTGVSYTRLFTKDDLELDWNKTSSDIFNKIRAFSTTPGCFTSWKDKNIKILVASKDVCIDENDACCNATGGEIISADRAGLIIGCGDGKPLSVLTLQPQDKKVMSYKDFINGYRIRAGDRFGQG